MTRNELFEPVQAWERTRCATPSHLHLGVMAEPRITLLTRPGCHLCEYAREALDRVTAASGVGWVEVSIEDDPELEREYGERIPVVLLDGAEHDYFRVDEARLLSDLAKPVSGGVGA